ncbi:hypothetical protein [Paraburkholderia diazotrophica]|uniref:Uncharacterized protein n=1 Tax=Paraburkholderia diazotrophica TaxID=667676 RepID=A0A1H7E0S0_9BURK|nr:hypothetical protein [Paraburkholderia diazotrophica]SEK07573.1 hypothetical protein SAMN05192539_10396 [Paraburkholderia diazotrophica]
MKPRQREQIVSTAMAVVPPVSAVDDFAALVLDALDRSGLRANA